MAFAHRTIPEPFLPQDWDDAWALGWFRMRQSLFTTHFLEFERRFHSAVWLRVGLEAWQTEAAFVALKRRNRDFRVEFSPAAGPPSDAQEAVYQRYRDSVAFEPAPTLRDLLLGDDTRSLFPTWQVELYDGARLIAGGFFDRGQRATAGIVSYYDPDYRRHSLGKYLIYLKMEYCREAGMAHFYPGYLAPGEPRFEYKRGLGAATLEYLSLADGSWHALLPGAPVPDPLADMIERLIGLKTRIEGLGWQPRLQHFLHLDINLNPQVRGLGLFDFPVFLDCLPREEGAPQVVAVYDPRDAQYHLLQCRSVYRFDLAGGSGGGVFESDLLSVERSLFSSPDPGDLAACLAWFPFPVRG